MADLLLAETGEPINTTAPIAAANANINPMDRFIGLPPLVDVLRSFPFLYFLVSAVVHNRNR